MFKLINDWGCVGMTEAPTYIRPSTHEGNNSYILCPEPEASGIVFEGTIYRLCGREMPGVTESVMLVPADAGTELGGTNAQVQTLKDDLATTDETAIELYEGQLAQQEINAAQDDALIELYELIGG